MTPVPHEQLARVDRSLIFPPLYDLALRLVQACNERGCRYFATHGFRSLNEQELLHRRHLDGGPKAAPAGLSAHNYGLALDFARDGSERPGLQPVWHSKDYSVLGEEAARLKLAWGGKFGDRPHVGWKGLENAAQLTPLALRWHLDWGVETNLGACWRFIDTLPVRFP